MCIRDRHLFSAKKKANKYLFEPFPSKDELLDNYEAGLDSQYEDLSDIDNLSDEEQSTIITEQKARISHVYNKMCIRDSFHVAGLVNLSRGKITILASKRLETLQRS